MKAIPAILSIEALSTLSDMAFPRYIAATDNSVNAFKVPMKTIEALYLITKASGEVCALSPHSVMKIKRNPERNGSLKWNLLPSIASPSLGFMGFINIKAPRIMRKVPDPVFNQLIDAIFAIYDARATATTSTTEKASMIPSNKRRRFSVLEASAIATKPFGDQAGQKGYHRS
ncbi:MAG: hypothetical protein QXU06_06195, partial [Candidatus Bathyarchaeia archaeon]